MSSTPLTFILGVFSSLSPCFFPLFPPFLAYVSNVENSISRGVFAGIACLLGIGLSFTLYGVLASFLFLPLIEYGNVLRSIFGLIVVLLGVVMFTDKIQIYSSIPQKLLVLKGYLGAFILGLIYALIAAPCAAPIFLSAILIAVKPGDTVSTAVNLLFFSLGAALPFLVSPLLVITAKNTLGKRYQFFAKWFKTLSSSILILTGLLLFLPVFGFPSIFY